jgi:hypothetical protein
MTKPSEVTRRASEYSLVPDELSKTPCAGASLVLHDVVGDALNDLRSRSSGVCCWTKSRNNKATRSHDSGYAWGSNVLWKRCKYVSVKRSEVERDVKERKRREKKKRREGEEEKRRRRKMQKKKNTRRREDGKNKAVTGQGGKGWKEIV